MKQERKPIISGPMIVLLVVLLSALCLSGCTVVHREYGPAPYPEQVYYDEPVEDYPFGELSSYGTWIKVQPFGLVWQPWVVRDWQPYLYGYWQLTEWGWTWISYEPFGWAVYHYGYWHYDASWGWVWLPGDEWSPARVQWVWADDYVSWTPYPPPGHHVRDPWDIHTPNLWVAVPARYFVHHDLNRFTVKPRSLVKYKSTTLHREAPTVQIIERKTKTTIRRDDVIVKPVKVGKREYKKITLPSKEQEKLKRYVDETHKRTFKAKAKTESSPESKQKAQSKTTEKKVKKTTDQQKKDIKEPQKTNKSTSKKKTKKEKG
jgi:hypothetical protein